MKKFTVLFLSLLILFSFSLSAFAANPVKATEDWLYDWEDRASPSGKMWQTPGKDENDRAFTWLSSDINNTFSYSDGKSSVTLTAQWKLSFSSVINTVKLKDLPDGEYTYTYTADGRTIEGKFSVSVNKTDFTAVFCSDPQLGRSGNDTTEAVQDDTYGWERTLKAAEEKGAELILSAGDQVNDGFSLTQYNALFSADTLKNVPLVPTAGNHDFYSPLYPAYFGNVGTDAFGNDSYFLYGNALFIVLDSNNIITPVHRLTISSAVKEYPDAKWRVVILHHGAYSSSADEFTNKICAGTLKSTFDEFDIDLALSGHNHFYSRTYPIYNGGISTIGTVYFEAGSASGGKNSSIDTADAEYIIHAENPGAASYSLLSFTDDTIEVNSYITDTGEIFDSFTVVNTKEDTVKHIGLLESIISFFEKILSYIPVMF